VGPEATASAIAAALLEIHPEYAGGRARDVRLDRTAGEVAPSQSWLERVQKLIAADDVKLHGRVVILGLARLDQTLHSQLADTGLLAALEAEIEEPIEQLFGDGAAEPDVARLASAAMADMPALVDTLGFTPLVYGLRSVLDDADTSLPLAVAVTGKWGAGKSSVMRQLERLLETPSEGVEGYRHWTIVRFDAWKYEHSERLWAALAKAIYEQSLEGRGGWLARLGFRIALEWRRLGWWRFLLRFAWPALVAAAAVAILLAADLSESEEAAGLLGLAAGAAGAVARYWHAIADPFKRAVDGHASHPDYDEHLGFTAEADRDIACLTEVVAPGERDALAVFVDDLDRCNSAHLVEVVEAINQIFNSDERRGDGSHRCVFVLGLDREMVATSIEAAYGATLGHVRPGSSLARFFGFSFIDKLVQLSVNVPRPRLQHLPTLVTPDVVATDAIDEAAIERLEKSRESRDIDRAEVAALSHLELNPRQAKRFHNVLRFQLHVAAAQGTTFDPEQTLALARWVALRVRWPALADDLDREPGLLKVLDAAANEEKIGEDDWTEEELRIREHYSDWFDDGQVTGVLLVSKEGEARRVSRLPLDDFLTVA
jgi:KAP family P-loop domain